MIANTPKPPYYAVIFTTLRTEVDEGYNETAERMEELAKLQDGYLGIESARNEIRPLIKVYKEHRTELINGYVFPVGDEPTNFSWSGFQNVSPDKKSGYLIVYRERLNNEPERKIKLKFVSNNKIKLVNLENGEEYYLQVDKNGQLHFNIEENGDFRFFKYEVLEL